jgi:hypothetical protein
VKVNDAVREEIIEQFGGYRLIQCMLGGKVSYIEGGIRIQWPNKQRSKGNVVEITLEPSDTYNMVFYYMPRRAVLASHTYYDVKKVIQTYTDVYCDQLQEIFESHTGWRLDVPYVRQAPSTAY